MTTATAATEDLDQVELDPEVHDRTDLDRWSGVQVRGYITPELEILTRAKGGDGRTVTGILVPYGREQQITPTLRERFRRGAAAHQVNTPRRMRFAHEHVKLGGRLIGRTTELRDDAAGLWGALRATPGVQAADEALAFVEDGALEELSVGFVAVRDKRHPGGLVERVRVNVVETALVMDGAYGRAARVTGMRSQDGTDAQGDDAEHGTDDGAEPEGMDLSALQLLRSRLVLPARTVIDLASIR